VHLADQTPARRPRHRASERSTAFVFRVIQVLVVLFCLAPALLVLGLSFFKDVFQRFPPHLISLSLYGDVIHSAQWRDAVVSSTKLAIPTAVLTVLVAAPAAIALERARIRGKRVIEFAVLAPLLVPATGYAVAIYIVYLKLNLIGNYLAVVVAESIISLPIAFLILRSALRRIDHRLEFIAMSLGASRSRAMLDVSVRLTLPAIAAGLIFATVHVFDDVLFISFLGGPGLTTLSQAIFNSIEFTLDPAVAALSAMFMIAMIVVIAASVTLRRRGAPE
jgi:putative spermidine/putrescine transport system permease protein